jgi:hypothetical protein
MHQPTRCHTAEDGSNSKTSCVLRASGCQLVLREQEDADVCVAVEGVASLLWVKVARVRTQLEVGANTVMCVGML